MNRLKKQINKEFDNRNDEKKPYNQLIGQWKNDRQ